MITGKLIKKTFPSYLSIAVTSEHYLAILLYSIKDIMYKHFLALDKRLSSNL